MAAGQAAIIFGTDQNSLRRNYCCFDVPALILHHRSFKVYIYITLYYIYVCIYSGIFLQANSERGAPQLAEPLMPPEASCSSPPVWVHQSNLYRWPGQKSTSRAMTHMMPVLVGCSGYSLHAKRRAASKMPLRKGIVLQAKKDQNGLSAKGERIEMVGCSALVPSGVFNDWRSLELHWCVNLPCSDSSPRNLH